MCIYIYIYTYVYTCIISSLCICMMSITNCMISSRSMYMVSSSVGFAQAAPCRSARFCVLLGTNGSEAVAGEESERYQQFANTSNS